MIELWWLAIAILGGAVAMYGFYEMGKQAGRRERRGKLDH